MKPSGLSVCYTCVLAISAIVAIPVLVSAMANGVLRFELGKIDWQALGAIGSFAAAWAAASAARAALAIDERSAARSIDREIRDATPLAHAIQRELYQASSFGELWKSYASDMDVDRVAAMKRDAPSFDCPILRSSIGKLGCFEYRVGASLGGAAVVVGALQALLATMAPITSDRAVQAFQEKATNYLQQLVATCDGAALLLAPYTGIELRDGKLEPAALHPG